MINKDQIARDKFQERVQKGMLGPGSDTWGMPDEEEIISDYPLQRYFTGILFPEKSRILTQFELDNAEVQNETSDDEEADELYYEEEKVDEEAEVKGKPDIKEVEESKISQNNFFPNNIGLTVCLDASIKKLKVEFSFGLYCEPKQQEVRIKIDENGYKSFFDEKIPYQLPFKEILKYENGFMFLQRSLNGDRGGKKPRSGEYRQFDDFKKKENLNDCLAKDYLSYLEKLISRVWKRKPHFYKIKVPIADTSKELRLSGNYHKELKVGYNVKTFTFNNSTYVKVQLVNLSGKHPANKFSNKNEKLNQKCLFQSGIKVYSDGILPYKTYEESTPFDEETMRLNFIYRKVKSYGIGHNCSVTWNKDHKEVKTTFIPYHDIKDIKNRFETDDLILDEALDIKNLSNYGLPKDKVIDNLNYFIDRYSSWINVQKEENEKNSVDERSIGNDIISNQEYNLKRLQSNIELLQNNGSVFEAFRIANTAMLIQLIISNDKDFGKYEKELNEINNDIPYNDLSFFKNYPFGQKNRLGERPQYRPFQLAFFLLSIDGIVDPNSDSRKNIVDLLWFPTGGGKTEAYLAVAAFTIIWRRLKNRGGYEGTSVIMRYTFRLLTSQQFERASRLIASLEFLRRQREFQEILKLEPISIGLWVGMGSTPNTLDETNKKLNEIERECNRGERGNPADKNVFQISACSWCGTKVISKDEKNKWDYSFETVRKNFQIGCLNNQCAFREGLPLQVIDEMLYKDPPTLLFATVDKFAMVGWRSEANCFFNSLDDEKLPPDLIIQDELHLLSGPLGSITGIFESIIEILCTKNSVGPKIIASTATTKNTVQQVKSLYGNREVNIFPPSGLNHNDSFFARESDDESKRRYLGLMPTGKTSIDTQLQLLAHLLIARLEVYTDKETKERINDYWTIVSYYKSLKDVGKTFNKVGDEVLTFTSQLQHRLSQYFQPFDKYRFNFYGISGRTQELTSRVESSNIKTVLKEIENEFTPDKIVTDQKGFTYLSNVVDLVLATNMISVGIDVGRLNIMLLNGMPKNVAEYIQASSRIGRRTHGLAIVLLDPNRAREKSYFEHFKPFHQAFYKGVEPLSVTPFTENTIKKMLTSILVSFVRQKVPGMAQNNQAQYFTKDSIEPLKAFIKKRFFNYQTELNLFEKEIDRIADDWVDRIKKYGLKRYDELLNKPAEKEKNKKNEDWVLMQSMREIDTDTYIQIKESF